MSDTYYKLETPFGNVWLKPTSGTHIHADANSNHNAADEYPTGSRKGPVTVNRVEYGAGAHLYLHPDGIWRIGQDNSSQAAYNSLYMSRSIFSGNFSRDEASNAARLKYGNALTALVNDWVKQHPRELAEAALEDAENNIERAVETSNRAEAAYQEATASLRIAIATRDKLRAAKIRATIG